MYGVVLPFSGEVVKLGWAVSPPRCRTVVTLELKWALC